MAVRLTAGAGAVDVNAGIWLAGADDVGAAEAGGATPAELTAGELLVCADPWCAFEHPARASDVTTAMELGCDGVLLNTAIAHAQDPLRMAWAMRHGCEAGRLSFLAGRIPRKLYAQASSPMEGRIAPGGA